MNAVPHPQLRRKHAGRAFRFGGVLALIAFVLSTTAAHGARYANSSLRSTSREKSASSLLSLPSNNAIVWVPVHGPGESPCAPGDVAGSSPGQAAEHVWCFEGANGDSSWPAVPPGQDDGSRHSRWDHWSKFAPPEGAPSKWHVTTRHGGATTGTYNAWCGCDSLGNPSCAETAFWIFHDGYADDWNYSLTLDMSGQNATGGGTIRFDLRYDAECNYDYAYLEYFKTSISQWQPVTSAGGRAAVFNAVSANGCSGHGGTGRCCGDDYFFHSDQKDLGAGLQPYYGNSSWLTNVTFPMPAQTGGLRLRWRCYSDGAWSDADGYGDTDGIAAIDNVQVTFAATGSIVSDTFESGDFAGVVATQGSATWSAGSLEGSTFDGWHLAFDPKYKNKGNTCDFSNDWMWSIRPAGGFPPAANGCSMFLATPVIDVQGWTGGVIEYASYDCIPDVANDIVPRQVRTYRANAGWSPWQRIDYSFEPFCSFWTMNRTDDLTPYLGANVDSLQFAWEFLDWDSPGDLAWGNHTNVNFFLDNVSIGRFDATATIFTARTIDLFGDTFSLVDPAHTSFLQNAEEGNWIANGGSRAFASSDSISIEIDDGDGITASNVRIFWRVGTGTPPTFGSWTNKQMVLSDPRPSSTTDEGTFRSTIGNVGTEDYSASEAGSLPGNLAADPIWDAGQTLEYYVRVTDDTAAQTVFPATADDVPLPSYLRVQILPQNRLAGSKRILLVDDYGRENLDFERSLEFVPGGGVGFGDFDDPRFAESEDLVERALALIYGGSEDFVDGMYGAPKWDLYNVQGGGSSVQREPRVLSHLDRGLGGIASASGVPNYDAVIWLQGSFDAYSYADTTRIELRSFLDHGGHLFSTGDEVAFFLGAGGQNADSTIQFLSQYFGVTFPSIQDDETADPVLDVTGLVGTSLEGVVFGLYGSCPYPRHAFDKLTEAPDVPGTQVSTTLASYQSGDVATNGRAAIMKNVRVAGAGVAVHCGFAIESLISDMARACLLDRVLTTDFGLPATSFAGCINSGTDAPIMAQREFGFELTSVRPNPFTTSAALQFSVPRRMHVSIAVYDILGRRVRTLVEETLDAALHVRDWDGRDDAGDRASSGIYFARMTAGDFTATKKIALLQ